MSLSEHDLQVLAELEHDLGSPSTTVRLYLLIQASRAAWGGLLVPAVAFAVGVGLLAAGFLADAAGGEVMIVPESRRSPTPPTPVPWPARARAAPGKPA